MIKNLRDPISEYSKTIKLFKTDARLYLINIFLMYIGYGIFDVLFNLYILQIGYDLDFIGYLTSLGNFGTALMAIPAGLIIHRFGLKRPLVISSLLILLFSILLVSTTSNILLITFNLALGFVISLSMVVGSPLLTKSSSKIERTHLFSFSFGLMMISSVIGSALGGYLPDFIKNYSTLTDEAIIYRISLILSSIISGLGLIPILKISKDKIASSNILDLRTFRIKNPKLITKLLTPHLLLGLGAGTVMPFFNVFFKKHLNAGTSQIGVIFAIGSLATGLASFLVPFVTKRFGKVMGVAILQTCSLPFLLLIALIPNLTIVAIFYVIRQALMNMASPIYSNFVMETVPSEEREITSGFSSFIYSMGWAISSFYSGIIMKNYGYNIPFFICFVFYLLSLVTFLSFFRKSEKK
jgi:MFS family permease